MNMENKKSDHYFTAFLWIVLGSLARLLPLPPNMAPTTAQSLFGGVQFSRSRAFAVTFLTIVISDILLAAVQGHAVFGLWSLFTYSGFAVIVLAGMWLRTAPTAGRTLAMLLASSLFFWTWTNFGVWLISEGVSYPHTGAGLIACYVAAIPFLGNALIADLAWGLVFFASFHYVRKLAPKYGLYVQGA
jgi:hypothetical protein